jgi:ATP-dependent Lhr-like helicase
MSWPGEELVMAHHGSLAREAAAADRGGTKGRPGCAAWSPPRALELGIDYGAPSNLVVQVESPGSVARGLQRIGRAGHT